MVAKAAVIPQLHSPRQPRPLFWEAASRAGGCWISSRGSTLTSGQSKAGSQPSVTSSYLFVPAEGTRLEILSLRGALGKMSAQLLKSDPEGSRNLVMDVQQSGINSCAKTQGICPPTKHASSHPLCPKHGPRISTAGSHRARPVQGHQASQLSGSRLLLPASSCGSSCARSSADCPRAEPSLLQPRSC